MPKYLTIAALLVLTACAMQPRAPEETWAIRRITIDQGDDFTDSDSDYRDAFTYLAAHLPSALAGKGVRGPADMHVHLTRTRIRSDFLGTDDASSAAKNIAVGTGVGLGRAVFGAYPVHKLEATICLNDAATGAYLFCFNEVLRKEEFLAMWVKSDYKNFYDTFIGQISDRLYK